MSNKPGKKSQMLPFQKATVRPITDPVERAALAESVKRSRVLLSIADMEDVLGRQPTLPAVLEWCRHLTAEDKLTFVTELIAALSAEQRIELKERLMTQLTEMGNPS